MILPSDPPQTPPGTEAADEFSLEAALERELSVLHRGLDPEEEARVIREFGDLHTETARISPACGDALGTRIARSRYDAVQAVVEARAADAFHRRPEDTASAVSLVPGGPEDPGRFAGALQTAGRRRSETVPREITAEDPRILLGRAYNQLIRPGTPLEWVRLLPAGMKGHPARDPTSMEETFLSSGDAVAPGAAGELLRLAREAARGDAGPAEATVPVSGTAAGDGAVGLRQIVGRSVTGGSTRGIAHHSGNPEPASRYILICDRFTSTNREELANAMALVEVRGTGFGPGAVAALELGIPHLYRAAEAGAIPEGENLSVNGDTGLLVRYEQD